MNRAASHALAAVVRAQSQGIFAAGDPFVVPIQLVRARFITHPVALRIPEWAGIESDNAKAGAGQTLQENAAARAHSDDRVIHLLAIGEAAHGGLNSSASAPSMCGDAPFGITDCELNASPLAGRRDVRRGRPRA